MNYDEIWPYVLSMGVLLALYNTLPLTSLDEPPGIPNKRFTGIDGLRGVLAICIFFHHFVVNRTFLLNGIWALPSSQFYSRLGTDSVTLFFSITGFVFWGKLTRSGVRTRWAELYIGRIYRLVPMYWFVLMGMLLIVLYRANLELHESGTSLLIDLSRWFAFGIGGEPDLNGERASLILAGVIWTVRAEWFFYLSLGPLAFFSGPRIHLAFTSVAYVASLFLLPHSRMLGYSQAFIGGMLCQSLSLQFGHRVRSGRLGSIAAGGILAIVYLWPDDGSRLLPAVLLTVFFYLVSSGVSLFGLLDSRAAQRLGHISYSVYLMQGLAITLVMGCRPIREFALASPAHFWSTGFLCMLLLVVASSVTFRLIEQPGIAMGRRVADRLRQRESAPSPSPYRPPRTI